MTLSLCYDGGGLDETPPQIALQQTNTPLAMKRLIRWSNDIEVETLIGRGPPLQAPLVEERLETRCLKVAAKANRRITMHQTGINQFSEEQSGAARGQKMIYIRTAVRIRCHEGRDSERIKVGPADDQPAARAMATR